MVTDAELVAKWRDGGRREALAAIFDRYAPALYDTARAMTGSAADAEDLTQEVFVAAAEQLGRLRDPEKLRPWMFAILRRAVYARSRDRSRVHARDAHDIGDDVMAPTIPGDELDRLAAAQLAADVRAAARGLDERDQYVLELVARQQLRGGDLAAALGVSVEQSYVLVSRMRDRVERSLGAYVVARTGRRRCGELDGLLAAWDGTLTPLLRKRIGRHIDGCAVCGETKRSAAPLSLVAAAPAAALPRTLRTRVLGRLDADGPPEHGRSQHPDGEHAAPTTPVRRQRSATRRAASMLRVAAVAAAIVAAVVAASVIRSGGDQSAVSTPPVTTGDLGASTAVSSLSPAADPELDTPAGADEPAADESDPAGEQTHDPDPTTTSTTSSSTTSSTTTSSTTTLPPGGWVVSGAFVATPAAVTITSVPIAVSCSAAAAVPVVVEIGAGHTADAVALAWSGPAAAGEIDMAQTTPSVWRADAALLGAGQWVLTATAERAGTAIGTDTADVVVTTCAPA